ncbi:heparinase II/III domain-containing protein [Maribellus maritimus]|uniref:heparinase II/III domain-containing protein n=1 Tax=Maribellus maritimus TaxID=2870838 RepID=UPI001EEB217B|nr:heparinase II/III family protein [Maribellus maritimus]MCG6189731.1 heparinase II/III-family protein [Maribellus maritimus]
MKRIFLLLIIVVFSTTVFSAEKRDLLQKEAAEINLAASLIKDFSGLDFPNYKSRAFWNSLPEAVKSEYIKEAESYLDYDWPVVKATDYLEIIRSGDRRQQVYAAPRAALGALVMGELTEGESRFIDQIVNGVWYYCEQTWWGWSAHLTAQKAPHGLPDVNEPIIDLGVGEIANILSWTWLLFKDQFDEIHPLIAKRLKNEIMKKAVIPYYERNDFWWQGLDGSRDVNNWNPWTNHNMLTAILILEDDQEKKIAGVEKVVKSLDQFVNVYPNDGGCDEGPSYWGRAGASLYQNLDLLKRATNGKFDVFDNQLIKNMGNYIYKAYINYPYFINFADADATTGGRPQIIYSYGKDINDPVMQKFGAFLAEKQDWGTKPPGGKVDEQIMQLMHLAEIKNADAENALISNFWLPETQVAGARDKAGSAKGFFFAAKGGHNAESHNHNDLGTCVLYYNGKPCLVDIGRETYTAKTFSSRRYEIWTMQSQYHNLPKINGVDQMNGRNFVATNSNFSANSKKATFSTDISKAYPEDAAVDKWERTYTLDRGKKFTIADNYVLSEVKDEPTTLNFVTNCDVQKVDEDKLQLKGDGFVLEMSYNPKVVTPEIEYTKITDSGLKRYWDGINRIVFNVINAKEKGRNEIVVTEVK